MTDAGFFRGTSAAQDNRFSDKEKKMMKQMKFADSLLKKVDMPRVKLDVIKPWITRRVTEMLGAEDEVLVEFVFNQLEEKNLNPRKMQINLTGFLNGKNARVFMQELWDLLCSASTNPSGIPDSFIEQKKDEIKKRNEDQCEREQLIRRQLEAERERVERQLSCSVRQLSPPVPRRSPAPEERRQRRRSRSQSREQGEPATDGPRRDTNSVSAEEANRGPSAADEDGTLRSEQDMDGTGQGEEAERGTERSETAQRRRGYRSNRQDSHDSSRKMSSRSRHSRSRSKDRRRRRSYSSGDSRSGSRSREARRSRSRSRDRYRSRSREPRRTRSRSREARRQSDKHGRRKPSASGRSSPASRRSPRRRSSSRGRRRSEKKQSSRAAAPSARSASPEDNREQRRGRKDARSEDREGKSGKRKRRAASGDESDVDKKKDKKKKKKKKKKHSKKHKKEKSRKRSRSVGEGNEPEKKSRGSLVGANAEGSGNGEPPLWRDCDEVRTVRTVNATLDSDASSVEDSDDHSVGKQESSPEPKNNGASPSPDRLSEDRGSPDDSKDSSSSSEDEDLEKLDMDLEELEKKLRERALRSMQRRQEIKAAMPPARESLPVSSPSSEDSE